MPNKKQRIDKDYYEWRKKVVERDQKQCQFPKCDCRKNLEVHHIFRYSDNPYLRTDVNNGITLCKTHHKLITGFEQHYAVIFLEIVKSRNVSKPKDV